MGGVLLPIRSEPEMARQTFVDLNSIPRAAIDSIEILKDGASTTYGADAVAGVVNIKFRHDYRGAETDIEYGNTLDKDSGEFAASLIFGVGDDKTSVSGVLNFYHRNSIFNRDRGYSSNTDVPSVNASPLNLRLSRDCGARSRCSSPLLFQDPTSYRMRTFSVMRPFSPTVQPRLSAYTYTPISGRSSSTSTPIRKRCRIQSATAVFGMPPTRSAATNWCFTLTFSTKTCRPVMNWRLPRRAPSKLPAILRSPFRRTLPGQPWAARHIKTPAFRWAHSIPSIRFNRSSPGARWRVSSSSATAFINNETDAYFSTLGLKGDKLFDGNWGYDAGFRYSETKNTSSEHPGFGLTLQPNPKRRRSNLRSHFIAVHRHDHSLQPFR